MHPTIFLDRDGVIIENRESYVRKWGHVDIFPQALRALARVANSPYKIVIVTNQSVVGRGIISLKDAQSINERLVQEIRRAGGRIDRVYMCPHRPDEGCNCRKPKPGMLYQAKRELLLDLKRSFMIGDALSDLDAAKAAGVESRALVQTGLGSYQPQPVVEGVIHPFQTYQDLESAFEEMIRSFAVK
jgi:histidinol-phosphate phosphatase family protein